MKTVIILKPFRDKDAFNTIYNPGETRDFDDERVAVLTALGLVEVPKMQEAEAPAEVVIPMLEPVTPEIVMLKTEGGSVHESKPSKATRASRTKAQTPAKSAEASALDRLP